MKPMTPQHEAMLRELYDQYSARRNKDVRFIRLILVTLVIVPALAAIIYKLANL